MKPHPRSLKSEIARSKRLKNFLSKKKLETLKRNMYNTRAEAAEKELRA